MMMRTCSMVGIQGSTHCCRCRILPLLYAFIDALRCLASPFMSPVPVPASRRSGFVGMGAIYGTWGVFPDGVKPVVEQ